MTPFSALRPRLPGGPLVFFQRATRRYGRASLVLALAVAIPLLANAILLGFAAKANGDRSSIGQQVQQAQSKADDRAQEVAMALAARPAVVASLPADVDSADVMDRLLRLTQESSAELVAVNAQGVSTQQIGDQDYRAFKFSAQVRARVSQMVAFLNRLEQMQQTPLIVQTVTAKPTDGQNWLVTVDLVTYAAGKAGQ